MHFMLQMLSINAGRTPEKVPAAKASPSKSSTAQRGSALMAHRNAATNTSSERRTVPLQQNTVHAAHASDEGGPYAANASRYSATGLKAQFNSSGRWRKTEFRFENEISKLRAALCTGDYNSSGSLYSASVSGSAGTWCCFPIHAIGAAVAARFRMHAVDSCHNLLALTMSQPSFPTV